ncbi:hypothetical protein N7512_006554 [Penicillium capsulatum]|nr:hypothetical protein N7512_006554 [Penicillium capsulatum]
MTEKYDRGDTRISTRDSVHSSEDQPKTIRRWFHWHEPGTSKAEKWLIFKLDFFILTYTCLTFFIKDLDQQNVSNAYVSGMKEDLHLKGNELNWFITYCNIGIIVGGPIITAGLTVVKPRFLLPLCSLVWSLFVLFMYKVQSAQTMYILRFFAGFFESAVMPGSFYIIGSWYRASEISRRCTMFMFASVGGGMFSGYIQAGLHANMNGRMGLASWRWVFIFDFILGLPVILLGIFCCPDEPKGPKPWWLSDQEQKMCIQRLADDKRDAGDTKWDLAALKRIFSSWQLYGFCMAWTCWELTCGVNLNRWMSLFLKSLKVDGHAKFSIEQINDLPTVIGCVEMAWMFLSSMLADRFQAHAWIIVGLGAVHLFAYIVFLVWSSNIHFLMAAYYLCSAAAETPAQQYLFPTTDAPRFEKTRGFVFGIVWVAMLMVWCGVVLPILERRFGHRHAKGERVESVQASR